MPQVCSSGFLAGFMHRRCRSVFALASFRSCRDMDAWVRKTATICIAKLYDINPELVEDQALFLLPQLCRTISSASYPIVSAAGPATNPKLSAGRSPHAACLARDFWTFCGICSGTPIRLLPRISLAILALKHLWSNPLPQVNNPHPPNMKHRPRTIEATILSNT